MTRETLQKAYNIQRVIEGYAPKDSEPENELARQIAFQIASNSGFLFSADSQIDRLQGKCLQLIKDFRNGTEEEIQSLKDELAAL